MALESCHGAAPGCAQRRVAEPPLSEPTVAESIGRWSAGVRVAALPPEVLRAAKRCLVDVTGVALAGCARPTARIVQAHVARESANGFSRVLGTDIRRRPGAAALANGTSAHVLDFDDTSFEAIAHASAVVFPAVFALAEDADSSGEELLAAFIAGVETVYALGRAFDELYSRGWWNTAVLGAIGAAAGAARMLRLDARTSAHAIASAACLTFGVRALLGTSVKPVGVGRVAEAGVQAAQLAQAGIDGPLEAFEESRGVAALFNGGKMEREALSSLGLRFSLVDPGVAFKLYPACSAVQAAAESVDTLMRTHGLTAERIVRVECAVTPLVAVSLTFSDPRTVTQAQFSLPFAIGCILRFGRFGVEELAQEVLEDAGVRAEMRKVSMVRCDTLVPAHDAKRHPEAADVTVHFVDGSTHRQFRGAATGMPSVPMSDGELDAKFLRCAVPVVGEARARSALEALWGIERVQSVREWLA